MDAAWARKTDLGDGRTVWSWVAGEAGEAAVGSSTSATASASGLTAAFLAATKRDGKPVKMTSEELAAWVREHPDSPETSALKAWAEDKEIFKDLKWGGTPEAERWRKTMEGVLASVASSKPPGALWRGAAGPDAPGWLEAIRKDGGTLVASPGDSFSLVRDISEEGYLNAGGFLMRLDEIDGAIDMAPVFSVTGGKGSRESEWVLFGGTRLALVGESVETVDLGGQKADVPVLLLKRIQP